MSYSLHEVHLPCTDIREKLMLQCKSCKRTKKQTILQKSNLYEAPLWWPRSAIRKLCGIL